MSLSLEAKVEFKWGTDEAVDGDFLKKAEKTAEALPDASYSFISHGLEESMRLSLLYVKYGWDKRSTDEIPNSNSFTLVLPSPVESLSSWAKFRNKEHVLGYGRNINEWEKSRLVDEYIWVLKQWNRLFVCFARASNETEVERRVDILSAWYKGVKNGSSQFMNEKFCMGEDMARLWYVYMGLNILISPERSLTPVARMRVVETVAALGSADDTTTLLCGPEFGYQIASSWAFELYIKKNLLRLPRRFWTSSEKTQTLHEQWPNNGAVRELLGLKEGERFGREWKPDWAGIFNKLVVNYPAETVHMIILMMTNRDFIRPAFRALLSLPKLDPITVQQVFGRGASYLRLHEMPSDVGEQIEFGLGVNTADTEMDWEGLNREQAIQLAQRYMQAYGILVDKMADVEMNRTGKESTHREEGARVGGDPKGYWSVMRLSPDLDEGIADAVIKAAYRKVAMGLHPDRAKDDKERKALGIKMQGLNEAYEVLSDPSRRAAYRRAR